MRPWATAVWLTGAEFGTVAVSANRRAVRRVGSRSRRSGPTRTRRGRATPRSAYGDTIEADLSRRDLTVNAMAVRVPDFRFVDPHGGLRDLHAEGAAHPDRPETFVRGRPAADGPPRAVRVGARRRTPTRRPSRPRPAMADQLTTVSAERVRDELVKLVCGRRAPRAASSCSSATGLSAHVLPELDLLRACAGPEAPPQGRVGPHPRGARPGHRPRAPPDRTAARLRAAPGRAAARHRQARHPEIHGDGTVTFHHHDVVGARMTRQRMRELKLRQGRRSRTVSELVRMHLRFHTFKSGWTDAAVRRYVRDAGDLLERLNALTRADVTTGNPKKAARIQRNVDDCSRTASSSCASRRSSTRCGRRSTATAIMRHLGDPARSRSSGGVGSTCSSCASTGGR